MDILGKRAPAWLALFFTASIALASVEDGLEYRTMRRWDVVFFVPSCTVGFVDTVVSAVLEPFPMGAAVAFTANIALLPEEFSDELLEDRIAGAASIFGSLFVSIVAPVADGVVMAAEEVVDIELYEEDYLLTHMFYPKRHLATRTAYEAFFDSDRTSCGRFFRSFD